RIPVNLVQKGDLDPVKLWSPNSPTLYDALVTVRNGQEVLDRVSTYFGMRKIEVCRGKILLNNTPLYQRLILDQGYWPDTLLTPPSDEALREDVELTLALGYNGARKHQKLEDPRYYYWADKLGMLVWGEVPSAYDFCDEMVANLSDTLLSFIDRDFNHPSLICWVPINESWGVSQIYKHKRQQETASMLYHLAKAADGTRLVSGNDGWEQVETDICALHD
ncbi:MAG: glycoside hydrolase family 2 TIM barrel-domain containing protein, partial [Clostridia bacterium]